MAAIAAAGIGAAAGLVGDFFSSSNAQATNQMNMQIAQMNNEFNAQQAALNRQFQEQQTSTAMQTRVRDLKAAGLNPLLAMGNLGGAQAMSGSTAQSAGLPQLQNPGAAFGNLGQQVTGAMQAATVASQIEANQASASRDQAQANKTDVETQTVVPANVDYLQSMTGLNKANAQVASSQVNYIAQQILTAKSDQELKMVQEKLTGENYDIIFASKQALISANQSDAQAKALGIPQLRNLSDIQLSNFGKVMNYINALLGPVSTALGAAGVARGYIPTRSQTSNFGPGGQSYGGSVTTTGPGQ